MNIGIDIRPLLSPLRTGIGEYTFELLNAIFELDKENQYFLFYNAAKNAGKNPPAWKQDNIRYVPSRWPNKLLNGSIALFNYPKLDQLALNTKYSILNTPLDLFYSPNLNFTSVSTKTKFILTIHDLSWIFYPEFFSKKQRLWHSLINPGKQCRRADLILTPSENTKRDIADFFKIKTDKIRVIYPGLSAVFAKTEEKKRREITTKIKKKYFLPDDFVLFLGAIEPRKNITGLIEAFEIARGLNTHLIIAGAPGWENSAIYKRASSSPIKERIKFIGYVEPEDKPALYATSSLFVYPSFYEGFGFPVLEAMASGVPVITSNRSSLPEVTGPSAYLIDPNRPAEIASAMKKLLGIAVYSPSFQEGVGGVADGGGAALRQRQIKNGLIQAAKFSWKKTAKEWLGAIKNLI